MNKNDAPQIKPGTTTSNQSALSESDAGDDVTNLAFCCVQISLTTTITVDGKWTFAKVHLGYYCCTIVMTKKSTSYELALPHPNPDVPAYQWLYDAMRSEILGGRLRPGARLPATRDLARQYGLARGTIVNAFEQLAAEGYVEGSVGSGTHVSKVLPDRLLQVAFRQPEKPATNGKRRPAVSHYAQRVRLFPGYEDRPTRAFRANLPALDLFPTKLWAKITMRCLRRISTRNLMGCEPLGYGPLRRAVAEYLGRSRGVRCAPEQVAIVSGVQEALDLTARLLLNPGDRVCVENPGYPGAILAFQAFRAKICPVGIDNDGMVVRQLPLRGVRVTYVTPAHQFPLGTTMSLARRLQLLGWARKSGAVIFEDDYDSEYRYSGRPIPALQGLDDRGLVLYAGSFSKVLFPALRLGYMVIPFVLLHHFEAALSLTVRHAPLLEQLALTDFITEGHFGRHVRRMREVYAERLSVLLDEARLRLTGLLEISSVEAGLQAAGWLSDGMNAESAATAAAKRDVEVTPMGRYSEGRRVPEGLQLGFAALDTKAIRRGVAELAIALDSERKDSHRGSKRSHQ
jgi:GntR family transcriptional regulator/MocR family aminotransferase